MSAGSFHRKNLKGVASGKTLASRAARKTSLQYSSPSENAARELCCNAYGNERAGLPDLHGVIRGRRVLIVNHAVEVLGDIVDHGFVHRNARLKAKALICRALEYVLGIAADRAEVVGDHSIDGVLVKGLAVYGFNGDALDGSGPVVACLLAVQGVEVALIIGLGGIQHPFDPTGLREASDGLGRSETGGLERFEKL